MKIYEHSQSIFIEHVLHFDTIKEAIQPWKHVIVPS